MKISLIFLELVSSFTVQLADLKITAKVWLAGGRQLLHIFAVGLHRLFTISNA